jgi:hydroxypyruvate isomerase
MAFSICIDAIFQNIDSIEALDQVKAAGFGVFEFWHWHKKNLDALAKRAAALSLKCSGFCTTSFNLTSPAQRENFLLGVKESIVAAKKMGASFLITQSGPNTGEAALFQEKSIVEGLKAAAPLVEEAGLDLLLEPLNARVDHPGIFLQSSDEGFEILSCVGSPNIKMLYDIYHQQITEGDIIRRVTSNIDKIGHFHCAANPGRHELDSGELDYKRIFDAINSLGYKGHLGLEYFPARPAAEGLKWLCGL